MFRSILPSHQKYAAFGLAVVLALGAAAFFITQQQPVPVTGAVNAVRAPATGLNGNPASYRSQVNNPGEGKWLTTLPDGLQILVPEPGLNANVAPSQSQAIDLGEGRLLVTEPDGAQRMVHSNPVQGQPQAPVSSAPGANSQATDLGEGRLLVTSPDGAQQMVHSNPVESQPQVSAETIQGLPDTGQGTIYRLETNAQGVRVVAPDRAAAPGDKPFNLGAGYRLLVTSIGGEILPPDDSATGNRQVDLGAGYVLTITDGYGRVNLPNGPIQPEPHDPTIHNEYIGGGFWLITGMDGSLILQDK